MALRVLSAIMFSPRGGSAHVARALATALGDRGCDVTLVAGSRSDLGRHGSARDFYGRVHAVDFDAALASEAPLQFAGGPGQAPVHPSFEDRPGAPDRVFAALDDLDFERQVQAWARALERAGARDTDVLHLHHLTPLNEAAARIAPDVPVVGQLHGTELLMLERIAAGAPASWCYAANWTRRMRTWAQRCARIVVAPAGRQRAIELLDLEPDHVKPLPNGVDVDLFRPRDVDRRSFWHRVLVEQPQGWLPDQPPGSVRYEPSEVATLASSRVLLYVGRFTAIKRLDQLIAAFGRAQPRFRSPAALVIVGGHPGEWEGEHPAQTAARLGISDVYLAGWRTHEELPSFFAAADAVVMCSEREQFGQVLVEGMACGLPAVATRSLGPAMIVEDGRTGWLVDTDDFEALAAAFAALVADSDERERRGRAARAAVRERYSWDGVASRLDEVLCAAVEAQTPGVARFDSHSERFRPQLDRNATGSGRREPARRR